MGFFDTIKHAFNPEIKETFDYLKKNYFKGLKSYCDFSGGDTKIGGYNIHISHINLSNPSYSDMKRIYDAKDAIIKIHESILFTEQVDADKKELKKLKESFPHAFVYFCNECLGGVIYDSSIKMPGEQKSTNQQDMYNSARLRSLFSSCNEIKCYYGNQYSPIPNNHGQVSYLNSNKKNYQTEPKSVEDLIYSDVKKILAKKIYLQEKKKKLLKTLEKKQFKLNIIKRSLITKDELFIIKNF